LLEPDMNLQQKIISLVHWAHFCAGM